MFRKETGDALKIGKPWSRSLVRQRLGGPDLCAVSETVISSGSASACLGRIYRAKYVG